MVRAGARVLALKGLLAASGFVEVPKKPPAPRIDDLQPEAADQLLELYRAMGGVLDGPPLRPGPWDIAYADSLVVELDEDMHFNRYRARTLTEWWERELPWAEPYRRYAVDWEHHAGTGGRRWTSPAAERMFGPADADGVFGACGAPRWKQRAFYDAMKDFAAVTGVVRLARLSIYDVVDGIRLDDALHGQAVIRPQAALELVEARSTHAGNR